MDMQLLNDVIRYIDEYPVYYVGSKNDPDMEFCVCGHLKREHDGKCLAIEPDNCTCLMYRRAKRNDT